MNDLKQYTDGDFILAKLEANYLFSTPESKLRPYLTAAAQYYSRPNQKFQGLPLGVGLSARINNSAYLNLQTAYDFGLGNDLAQSLVTGISLRFPLTKSKSSPSSSQEKEKKGVVVLKPIEKPQPAVVKPQATAQASAPAPVAKAETQPAAPAVSNSETVLAVAKPETQPAPQPVSKPETVLAAAKSAPKALTELYKVVYFDTDQALLSRPGTLPTLVEVVDFMNAHPQSKAHLAGHTDLRASIDYNIQLSKKRVTAVYQFLINAGISPDRISVNYFGKSKPATTASAADAMLSNRRTEIWVK